jgi:hypothetical protein
VCNDVHIKNGPHVHFRALPSMFICSLGGSLPQKTQLGRFTLSEIWNSALSVKAADLRNYHVPKSVHMCAANWDLSCLLHAVSFWTAHSFSGFRHRLF